MSKRHGQHVPPAHEPANAPVATDAPADATPASEPALTAWETERQELVNTLQRLQADFDNYRRRMERDVADSREQANDKILRDILPIHDHLTLSIQHAKSEDGAIRAQELLDGVIMINDQLHAILSQHGLEPIPEDGAFDPRLHEAIATHDGEKGSVRTYQRGYRRGAKIVRPAKVSVAK